MSIKDKLEELKHSIATIYLAMNKPETPWIAKFMALLTVAYALSPIDLIPDFIPVLGYLDDLIILPIILVWIVFLVFLLSLLKQFGFKAG